ESNRLRQTADEVGDAAELPLVEDCAEDPVASHAPAHCRQVIRVCNVQRVRGVVSSLAVITPPGKQERTCAAIAVDVVHGFGPCPGAFDIELPAEAPLHLR